MTPMMFKKLERTRGSGACSIRAAVFQPRGDWAAAPSLEPGLDPPHAKDCDAAERPQRDGRQPEIGSAAECRGAEQDQVGFRRELINRKRESQRFQV